MNEHLRTTCAACVTGTCDGVHPDLDPATLDVTISGKTYDGVSGGGLFQSQEYADIAQEFRQVRRGRGYQYKATLTFDQVARVERHLQGYGELFTGPGFDPGDRDTPAEGRACLKDAARMRAQLDAAEEVAP